jgi:hypothetical protein
MCQKIAQKCDTFLEEKKFLGPLHLHPLKPPFAFDAMQTLLLVQIYNSYPTLCWGGTILYHPFIISSKKSQHLYYFLILSGSRVSELTHSLTHSSHLPISVNLPSLNSTTYMLYTWTYPTLSLGLTHAT